MQKSWLKFLIHLFLGGGGNNSNLWQDILYELSRPPDKNVYQKNYKQEKGEIWIYTLRSLKLRSKPEVIKPFPCSTQLSKKFILLKNVKMSTIVGILTYISMKNTTSERLKARNFFICRYFSFYEQLKFLAQLSWASKKFNNLRLWSRQTKKLFSINITDLYFCTSTCVRNFFLPLSHIEDGL